MEEVNLKKWVKLGFNPFYAELQMREYGFFFVTVKFASFFFSIF